MFVNRFERPANLKDGTATDYADGWFIDKLKNKELIWHTGGWLSYRSYVGYLPEKKTWVAVFSNYGDDFIMSDLGKEILSAQL